MEYCYLDTPIGPLLMAGNQGSVCRIEFAVDSKPSPPRAGWQYCAAAFAPAREQLAEFFAGDRTRFTFDFTPTGTEFQLDVLRALQRIPYGCTCSYRELAEQVGRPAAVRAVGAAIGRNPLPVVIPCHRVIGSDGRLTGFAGGLEAKRWLLALEAPQASMALRRAG